VSEFGAVSPHPAGSMQDYRLTVDRFLDHAAKWHGRAPVITGSAA